MILGSDSEKNNVGIKAARLQDLTDAGYVVPNFIVLTPDYLSNIDNQDLLCDVKKNLATGLYAVRSAAFAEDGATGSQAGQFLTKLAVSYEDVLYATLEVVKDAQEKVDTNNTNFSVIVQEFIEPEYAGVLFTRNPLGSAEMTLEYVSGRGEQVVSGNKSVSISLFADAVKKSEKNVPFLKTLVDQAKKIEKQFEYPQDIEWAYADGQLYILQSRPITSLTKAQYQEFLYLDKTLPSESFYYEQTSVTESFSRPTPLALSTLNSLYAAQGPLQKAYASLSIDYSPVEQFVLVGNQLYVDKQAEAHSLFPSLGFLKHHSTKTKLETFSGAGVTVKNLLNLTRVSVRSKPETQAYLIRLLKKESTADLTLEQSVQNLQMEYKTIFEVNVRAQLALTRLLSMAGSEEMTQKILTYTHSNDSFPVSVQDVSGVLIGNSLSIDDTSDFLAVDRKESNNDSGQVSKLSFKETALLPKAKEVNEWLVLRELGRWLTVRLVSDVRKTIEKVAETKYGHQKSLIYFATITEVLEELPTKEILSSRKLQYEEFDRFNFQKQLSSFDVSGSSDQSAAALSPGVAQGILCIEQEIKNTAGRKILFVDALTPNLTQYFGHIDGIVCCRGGLLSHLAIVAREAGLPVVLDPRAKKLLGEEIVIDTAKADKIQLSKKL